MKNEKQPNFIVSIISTSLDISKSISDDFRSWMRPYIRVPVFFFILVFALVCIPIVIPIRLLQRRNIDSFFKLRSELETKWYGESKNFALTELRRVHQLLKANEEKLFFKGIFIEPYGKFKHQEYSKILWLIYHWEFQLGHYKNAEEICDEILKHINPDKNITSKYFEEWTVNKARVISKIDSKIHAEEFLLKYCNPGNKDNPIMKYLHQLRE